MIKYQYVKVNNENRLVLNDDVINDLIEKDSNLNITGYDMNEDGSSSPLMYSIYNNKKDLFLKLLNANADINYKIDIYEWTAMQYAIRYQENFYIERLLETEKIDFTHKINGLNAIEHTLSNQRYPEIEKKDYFYRLALYINKAHESKILPQVFFNSLGIFHSTFQDEERYSFLLKSLPKDWLSFSLNREDKNGHITSSIFEIIKNKKQIDKIIESLEIDKKLTNGNTILQYYVFESTNKNKQIIIQSLLEQGHNPNLRAKNGKTVEQELKDQDFYKEFKIKKHKEKLENELKLKENNIPELKI